VAVRVSGDYVVVGMRKEEKKKGLKKRKGEKGLDKRGIEKRGMKGLREEKARENE
jgi:hypothetical protein